MTFRVRIYCRDCFGEDDKGCFDGGSEWVNDGEEYENRELAESVGAAETKDCHLWEFEVVEVIADEPNALAPSTLNEMRLNTAGRVARPFQ